MIDFFKELIGNDSLMVVHLTTGIVFVIAIAVAIAMTRSTE